MNLIARHLSWAILASGGTLLCPPAQAEPVSTGTPRTATIAEMPCASLLDDACAAHVRTLTGPQRLDIARRAMTIPLLSPLCALELFTSVCARPAVPGRPI